MNLPTSTCPCVDGPHRRFVTTKARYKCYISHDFPGGMSGGSVQNPMKFASFSKNSIHQLNRCGGFSLLELLVVIAVIAILSVLMMPAFNAIGQARSLEKAGADISAILEGSRV